MSTTARLFKEIQESFASGKKLDWLEVPNSVFSELLMEMHSLSRDVKLERGSIMFADAEYAELRIPSIKLLGVSVRPYSQ